MKKYYIGHIANADPLHLEKTLVNSKPCTDCDISGMCGGRCLYANITKRWGEESYALVCETVRSLIKSAESQMPQIRQLISNGKISLTDFEFLKYNGCEIIP